MTTNATIPQTDSSLLEGRVGGELQPAGTNLRQRIERLLHEVFEGHEEFLGATPEYDRSQRVEARDDTEETEVGLPNQKERPSILIWLTCCGGIAARTEWRCPL